MTIRDYKKYLEDNSEKIPIVGCWLWKKSQTSFGHGMATRKDTGCTGLAHRESYKEFVGTIPDNMQVNHICNNPTCINPSHLYLGTQKQNMLDVSANNRWPDRKGENCYTSKLTKEDVEYIRNYPVSYVSKTSLAKQFNISKTTITDIIKGRSWKSY